VVVFLSYDLGAAMRVSVALCVYSLAVLPIGSPEANASGPVDVCIRAIQAIETVEATVRNAVHESKVNKNALYTDSGAVVLSDFSVRWEAIQRRCLIRGKFFSASDGVGSFTPFWMAYDGQILRTYGPNRNRGQLIEAGSTLAGYRHVALLLGHGIVESPSRDVAQLLASGARELDPISDSVRVVEVPYVENEGSESRRNMLLRIQVDLDHGGLPSRIQCLKADPEVLQIEVVITDFHEIEGGLWVPVAGTLQLFDLSIHVPPGHTFDEVAQMSLEERAKIGAHYIPAPLSTPEEIHVATDGLRVNQALKDEDLTFRFPEGARVFDDFRKVTLVSDASGLLRPLPQERKPAPREAASYAPYLALVALNAVVVSFFAWVFARRKQR
jgi:hypothetical protein